MLLLENRLAFILLASLLVVLVGYIWLLKRAFDVSRGWGFLSLFVPVIGPLFFSSRNRPKARLPLVLILIGLLGTAIAYSINQYQIWYPDLGERAKMVDGGLHLTLTGWNKKSYAPLGKYQQAVLLQMANPDVTDETIEFLKNYQNLKELDINDTKVTDQSLPILAKLPLEALRMRGTAITDEGFRSYLMGIPTLNQLDLRKTGVKSSTLREWKNAGKNRSYLQ